MSRCALLARLEAKPGKEEEVERFLRGALPLAEAEPGTRTGSRCASGRPPSASTTPSTPRPAAVRTWTAPSPPP